MPTSARGASQVQAVGQRGSARQERTTTRRREHGVTRYLGIDLAWAARARTGMAALDEDGRLVASTSVVTDDEIAAFVGTHAPGTVVAAVDAPLVVPNATGSRVPEQLVSREFGPYHAGAYPSNRSRPLFDPPRGETLCRWLGWDPDPATAPGGDRSVAIEVYPHPAMVVLFALATVLPYKAKRGRDVDGLRTAFLSVLDHMERVCDEPLRLTTSPRWAEIRAAVTSAGRIVDLDRVEDEVDAVLCAYLAWLWGTGAPGMRVIGDVGTGYIVVPGTPSVPPARRATQRPVGKPLR
jgi:predicted RNase H-like nuclease